MKKFLTVALISLTTFAAFAQNIATFKFLGVPVDGRKSEFISALKNKGFTYDVENDCLIGKFNGLESHIYVSENYGKVDRVAVMDANTVSEAQIRIRFNNLLQQFKDNDKKYFSLGDNDPIPDSEDISYELTVHNKVYEAAFYFNPYYGYNDEDRAKLAETAVEQIRAGMASGEYSSDLSDETVASLANLQAIRNALKDTTGQVWFRIAEFYGKYYICLYYDNLKNRPNGEDL